jgi:hypothetical protein
MEGTPGTAFKLCWSHVSEATPADMNLTIDTLGELRGPAVEEVLKCTLGLACVVTLTGYGFSNDDKILPISSGGCGDAPVVNPETWNASGPSSISGADDSTAVFSLGTPVRGAPGTYSLCWGYNAVTAEQFTFRVAAAGQLFGPQRFEFTCSLGDSCVFSVSGVGLNASNGVVLVESSSPCGSGSAVVIKYFSAGEVLASVDGSTVVEFTNVIMAAQPGSAYRLCWGHAPGTLEDYAVELDGDATLVGPDYDSFSCFKGTTCTIAMPGEGLAASNVIKLKSGACGAPGGTIFAINPTTIVNSSYAIYTTRIPDESAVGNNFSLCWGANPDDMDDDDSDDTTDQVQLLSASMPIPTARISWSNSAAKLQSRSSRTQE